MNALRQGNGKYVDDTIDAQLLWKCICRRSKSNVRSSGTVKVRLMIILQS